MTRSLVDRLRPTLHVALVHIALFLAIWMWSVVVYAIMFTKTRDVTWLAIDTVLFVAGGAFALSHPAQLGFRSLAAHRRVKLVAITLLVTVAVLACQRIIPDWRMVALDESHYLKTLREERIITDGLLPFNVRWLVPFLAGPWNLLPLTDMEAIKAINFGAFVVTGVALVLLLVRLRVPLWLASTAPLLLLSSYLGIYGAHNRLVLDPANYALYVLMFHALLRREHWPHFAIVLFIDALNAEKAVYWLPVFVLATLLHEGPPWTKRSLGEVAKVSAFALGPAIVYMAILWLNLTSSRLEANLCFENLHLMSFSNLGGQITENVATNNFQTLWLPFGPFTVFALCGFALDDRRWMKPIALLLVPIFIQALIACDTDRMLAYSFIVYLPFGFLYLARMVRDLPRLLGIAYIVAIAAIEVLSHFYIPWLARRHATADLDVERTKMWFSALEIVTVGSLLFVHFTLFRRRPISD